MKTPKYSEGTDLQMKARDDFRITVAFVEWDDHFGEYRYYEGFDEYAASLLESEAEPPEPYAKPGMESIVELWKKLNP